LLQNKPTKTDDTLKIQKGSAVFVFLFIKEGLCAKVKILNIINRRCEI